MLSVSSKPARTRAICRKTTSSATATRKIGRNGISLNSIRKISTINNVNSNGFYIPSLSPAIPSNVSCTTGIPIFLNRSCLYSSHQTCSFSTSTTNNARSKKASTKPSKKASKKPSNPTSSGIIPGFAGKPLAASPASLRLQAKAAAKQQEAEKSKAIKSTKVSKIVPPAGLSYTPQRGKPSSAFFWSKDTLAYTDKLLENPNYPPPLPTFTNTENQHIAKFHPSTWVAPRHHLQIMYESYERLEFLGDSIISRYIAEMLMDEYYCISGTMTTLKSYIQSNAQFAHFSRLYKIPCSNVEKMQADAFEALAGALYLDGLADGLGHGEVDKILGEWIRELIYPWVRVYIGKLPSEIGKKVVSIHEAIPVGIAVATSASADSEIVMVSWESNIGAQMIRKRGLGLPTGAVGFTQAVEATDLKGLPLAESVADEVTREITSETAREVVMEIEEELEMKNAKEEDEIEMGTEVEEEEEEFLAKSAEKPKRGGQKSQLQNEINGKKTVAKSNSQLMAGWQKIRIAEILRGLEEAEAAEKLAAERLAAEKLAVQNLEAKILEAERLEAERLEAERLEAERLEAERLEAERVAEEKTEMSGSEPANGGESFVGGDSPLPTIPTIPNLEAQQDPEPPATLAPTILFAPETVTTYEAVLLELARKNQIESEQQVTATPATAETAPYLPAEESEPEMPLTKAQRRAARKAARKAAREKAAAEEISEGTENAISKVIQEKEAAHKKVQVGKEAALWEAKRKIQALETPEEAERKEAQTKKALAMYLSERLGKLDPNGVHLDKEEFIKTVKGMELRDTGIVTETGEKQYSVGMRYDPVTKTSMSEEEFEREMEMKTKMVIKEFEQTRVKEAAKTAGQEPTDWKGSEIRMRGEEEGKATQGEQEKDQVESAEPMTMGLPPIRRIISHHSPVSDAPMGGQQKESKSESEVEDRNKSGDETPSPPEDHAPPPPSPPPSTPSTYSPAAVEELTAAVEVEEVKRKGFFGRLWSRISGR